MLSPENNEISQIFLLNDDELLELFNYLDFCTLKECRLVCQHWRMLINEHRVYYRLVVGHNTALDINEAPLSILATRGNYIKKLVFRNDFYEYNEINLKRQKFELLVEILGAERVFESVTDLVIEGPDVDSEMLSEQMQRFKNLKSIHLEIEKFESVFKNFRSCIITVETLTIDLEYEKRSYLENSQLFHLALKVFPNTKEIHIEIGYGRGVNIEEFVRLVEGHESKIKSVSYLVADVKDMQHKNLFIDLHNFPKFREISLFCFSSTQNELNKFFDRPYQLITEFEIKSPQELDNLRFLRWMPNLQKLELTGLHSTHFFGHELIEFRKLEDVRLQEIESDCNECVETMFRSFIHIKKLDLFLLYLDLENIASILQNYNLEELDSDFEFLRFFCKPTLKKIGLIDVGSLTENSIEELSRDCLSLEKIALEDVRVSNMKEFISSIVTHFPNIKHLQLYDYDNEKIENLNEVFTNGNGWRLQALNIGDDLDHEDVLQLFRKLHFLQTLRYDFNEGISKFLTRRIYHEVDVLKKYTLDDYFSHYFQ